MPITLAQFEAIDGLRSRLIADPFETCTDPRAWIKASNRLLDYCIDAMGAAYVDAFPSAEYAASAIITESLLSADFVIDETECMDGDEYLVWATASDAARASGWEV